MTTSLIERFVEKTLEDPYLRGTLPPSSPRPKGGITGAVINLRIL